MQLCWLTARTLVLHTVPFQNNQNFPLKSERATWVILLAWSVENTGAETCTEMNGALSLDKFLFIHLYKLIATYTFTFCDSSLFHVAYGLCVASCRGVWQDMQHSLKCTISHVNAQSGFNGMRAMTKGRNRRLRLIRLVLNDVRACHIFNPCRAYNVTWWWPLVSKINLIFQCLL